MSQQPASDFDIVPTSTSGTELAAYLNNLNGALLSMRSGTTLPPSSTAGTVWRDTTSATTHIVKYYNGTVSTELYSITVSTGVITIPTEVILKYADDNFAELSTANTFTNDNTFKGDYLVLQSDNPTININAEATNGNHLIAMRDSLSFTRAEIAHYGATGEMWLERSDSAGLQEVRLTLDSDGITSTGKVNGATVHATNGASGTATSANTLTVVDGIITNIA